MRSLHLLALSSGIALATMACGGDNGNGPDNVAPTASFAAPACQQGTACTFTDASTDSDGSIASRSWTFENGTPPSSTAATQPVTFTATGPQTVTLTVTDNEGATDDFSLDVNVTGPGGNQPPTADFSVECSSLDCSFTNESSDPDGTFTSVWNFGDGNTSPEASPDHSYNVTVLTPFTVTLTVTDDDGATAVATQEIDVAPPASLTCGTTPDCELLIEQPATVVVTLVSEDCELSGNTFTVTIDPPSTDPVEVQLFDDGCNETTPQSFNLQNGAIIEAGTVITASVVSGGTVLEIPPAIRVEGTFATGWTLRFDDGARAVEPPNPGPDFNDLIITIQATP